jgi:hypothetical protein
LSSFPTNSRKGNGLALLANKCAARTFDISSGMVYASMRDQIVRAQLLIRDLAKSDPDCERIFIVGAGLAGITAACCAFEFGIKAIVLESGGKPLSLQDGVHNRLVGPFMYEWPNIVADSQAYPLAKNGLGDPLGSTPSWEADEPISAHELSVRLETWLKNWREKPERSKYDPEFYFDVKPEVVRKYVRSFVGRAGNKNNTNSEFKPPQLLIKKSVKFTEQVELEGPDYIVLAVGMGKEETELVAGCPGTKGPHFWQKGKFICQNKMNKVVGVFGGGDGALQDVLRLTTQHSHPLEFIAALKKGMNGHLDEVLPQLDSLEQQSRLIATWSAFPVYDLIDQRCKDICIDLLKNPVVDQAVKSQLRKGSGTVFHVFADKYFGKAYLLNRFCMHLISQFHQKNGKDKEHVTYEALPGKKAIEAQKNAKKIEVTLENQEKMRPLDKIFVRYGPKKNGEKMIQLSKETTRDRVCMSAIPLPYDVLR